nr:hypothetical protein Iba_chr01fCG8250 [Ipomoea batatas]
MQSLTYSIAPPLSLFSSSFGRTWVSFSPSTPTSSEIFPQSSIRFLEIQFWQDLQHMQNTGRRTRMPLTLKCQPSRWTRRLGDPTVTAGHEEDPIPTTDEENLWKTHAKMHQTAELRKRLSSRVPLVPQDF